MLDIEGNNVNEETVKNKEQTKKDVEIMKIAGKIQTTDIGFVVIAKRNNT